MESDKEQKYTTKNEETPSETSGGKDQSAQPTEKPEKQEQQEIETKRLPSDTVEQEVEDAKNRANQLYEALQRLTADFENYRKRVAKERQEIVLSANASLILKFLDLYEGLKKAIDSFPSGTDANYLNGLNMLYDEFSRILKKEGLEQIETIGKPFDVHKHEVLMQQINDDLPEDTILEEIQTGYMLNSRVLRHAKVVVSQKSPPPEEQQEEIES